MVGELLEWECQSTLALRKAAMVREWDVRNLHSIGDSVIGVTKHTEWPSEWNKSSLELIWSAN